MRPIVLVLLAGCWTGSGARTADPDEARPRDRAARLEISLERGSCFGPCPIYKLAIRADGRVEWRGAANVAAIGTRTSRIARAEIEALDREVEAARFFDRDRFGALPRELDCVTSGKTTTCTFTSDVICSSTSPTILTVRRGARSHRINVSHCADEDAALDRLEARIIERTSAAAWIGR